MPSELTELAQELLDRISLEEPQFLVEYLMDDATLQRVCALLRAFQGVSWKEPDVALLALSAVQIASETELEDEGGFRPIFYDRLGLPFDAQRWDSVDGPAIAEFLGKHFDEQPREGPYRYVAPIYRQAGITARALASFASTLWRLRQRFGLIFSRAEYRDALTVTGLSRAFLESDLGYHFAVRTLELLDRLERGLLTLGDLVRLPGYRPGFWTDLRAAGPAAPRSWRAEAAYRPPSVCLDVSGLRLVLRFDAEAVTKGRYRVNGQPVHYPEWPITSEDPPMVEVRRTDGSRLPQAVDNWWTPATAPVALFRVSDGALVAWEGDVKAGRYYLVADPSNAPAPTIVLEELLWLDVGFDSGMDARVWVVDLPPDHKLGANLRVTTGDRVPSISFADAPNYSRLGDNLFVGRLPVLKVQDWTERASRQYWIWLRVGDSERRLEFAPYTTEVDLAIGHPTEGGVRLEPKGFVRRSAGTFEPLTFAVLPAGISWRWEPDPAGESEPVRLFAELPSPWRVVPVPSDPSCDGQTMSLREGEREAIGQITDGKTTVGVSFRAPRIEVDFPGHRRPIVWLGRDLDRVQYRVTAPRDFDLRLLLSSAKAMVPFLTVGRLPRGGRRQASIAESHDVLETTKLGAGELVVSTGKRTIPTGWFLAQPSLLKRGFATAHDDWEALELPGVGRDLQTLQRMLEHPVAELKLAAPPSEWGPLRRFIGRLASASKAFDGTLIDSQGPEPRYSAHWHDLLQWAVTARKSFGSGDDPPDLGPGAARLLARLPVARWRDLARSWKPTSLDYAAWFDEWRTGILERRSLAGSRIHELPGGRRLTEGARRYLEAMSVAGRARQRALKDACREFQAVLGDDASIPVAKVAGAALLQVALYRLEEFGAAARLEPPLNRGVFARLASTMRSIALVCRGERHSAALPAGIGLAQVSPVADDKRLEELVASEAPWL
jgi:hypothetical protein